MSCKISVIIPTYKPKEYLWVCLDSLVKQTFPRNKFEIIIVLNGCNEPWNTEIQRYISAQMKDLNIRFIQTNQGGVSNARNRALDIAHGEYIAFIDDDDFVSPRYLELLYKQVSPNTISICYPYSFNDGEEGKQLPYPMTDIYECYYTKVCKISSKVRKFFSGPCMKLIPMNFIQNRRFDVRLKNGEDTLFMFLISDVIDKIKFSSREAIYYRRNREGSAVNVKRPFRQIIKYNLLQIFLYLKYYLKSPFQYNLYFLITRIGGALYSIIKCK